MNQKQWIAALEANGRTMERGGKHSVKMTKPGHRPITLPRHRGATYGRDLHAQVKRQAGL